MWEVVINIMYSFMYELTQKDIWNIDENKVVLNQLIIAKISIKNK